MRAVRHVLLVQNAETQPSPIGTVLPAENIYTLPLTESNGPTQTYAVKPYLIEKMVWKLIQNMRVLQPSRAYSIFAHQ